MKRLARWLLICGVAGLLVLAGVVWITHDRATETLEESERLVDGMLTAQRALGDVRPTLGPPSRPGDARDVYDKVLAHLDGLDAEEEWVLLQLQRRGAVTPESVEPAEAAALLSKTERSLVLLRPVLGIPTVRQLHADGAWPAPDVAQIPHWSTLSEVVSAHVQEHVLRGEIDAALDLCVLRWFAALDLARHGSLVAHLCGTGIVDETVEDLRWILADCDVSAERLARLAAELDHLRNAAPTLRDAWRIEEIYLRRLLARDSAVADIGNQAMAGARFLFSGRLLCADTLERFASIRDELFRVVRDEPAPAAERAARAVVEDLEDDPNELLRVIFVVFPRTVAQDAEARALVELLRVTVALARYREARGALPPALDDLVPDYLDAVPVCSYAGAPLRYDGERVWSIGADGIDEDGAPLAHDQGMDADGDVVFTLRTRRLQRFPWLEEVDARVRAEVQEDLRALYRGGREAGEARARLVDHGSEIAGRLIGEFAAIDSSPGLGTAEGRAMAGAIDETLRAMDGFMEHRWREHRTIRAGSQPAFARLVAERWTNWWARRQWETDPQWPVDPENAEPDAAEGDDDR